MEETTTPALKEEKVTAPAAAGAPTGVGPASGSAGEMPAELKGWNWGAFFLSWIWGVGHRVWISLAILALAFIPVIGTLVALVGSILLGLKGNELAWKNRHFESVEQFRKVQKAWAIWGLVIFILGLILMLTTGAAVFSALQDSGI